jgi:hypothetical protein
MVKNGTESLRSKMRAEVGRFLGYETADEKLTNGALGVCASADAADVTWNGSAVETDESGDWQARLDNVAAACEVGETGWAGEAVWPTPSRVFS